MTDDHARAAEIDQLTSALGWTKGLLAQAQRDRKATQTLLNMERAVRERFQKERDEWKANAEELETYRSALARELALLRAVGEAAEKDEHDPMENRHCSCLQFDLKPLIAAWRAHAPKP